MVQFIPQQRTRRIDPTIQLAQLLQQNAAQGGPTNTAGAIGRVAQAAIGAFLQRQQQEDQTQKQANLNQGILDALTRTQTRTIGDDTGGERTEPGVPLVEALQGSSADVQSALLGPAVRSIFDAKARERELADLLAAEDRKFNRQKALKETPLTPEQQAQKIAQRRAGRTSVDVKLPSTRRQTKEQEEIGKFLGKSFGEISTQGKLARRSNARLGVLSKALEKAPTGPLATKELGLRRFFQSIGIDADPETIASGEVAVAFQNRLALELRNPDNGGGLPGAASDRDVQFLLSGVAGLTQSREGRQALIRVETALNNVKIKRADLARQHFRENGTMLGFEEAAQTALKPEFDAVAKAVTDTNALLGTDGPVRVGVASDGAGGTKPIEEFSLQELRALDIDALTPEQQQRVDARLKQLGF